MTVSLSRKYTGVSWCVVKGRHKGKVNSKKTFIKASFTQGRKTWETKKPRVMSSYQLVEHLSAPLSEDIGYVHYYMILHNPNSEKKWHQMIGLIRLPPFSFTKNEKGINSISAAIELFLYYYHRQMPSIKLGENVDQN